MKQQRGVALIMVLMIFAIVSVLATVLIERQSRDINRGIAQLSTQQSRALNQGVESVVRSGLRLDWEADPDIDHAFEEWNIDRTFPMENGSVFVHISDAQSRFNLNWLSPDATGRAVWQERFYKLLNDLGLDVAIAGEWANWLDPESQIENNYLNREVPYRPAYRTCMHTSELMLIDGVDADAYAVLEPYIACLPATTQLNVNTASAAVLASLDKDLTIADGQSLVSERGDEGWSDVDDFLAVELVQRASQPDADGQQNGDQSASTAWSKEDFNIKTEYFEVFSLVAFGAAGEWVTTSETLLKRTATSGDFTTVYRDYSRRKMRPMPAVAAPQQQTFN